MSDKSELEYLAEAIEELYPKSHADVIHRAIERRKQDLAKADAALLYTNREKLYMDTPQNVPNTADNTPKGGGDDLSKRLRNWMTTPFGIHGTAELCDEAASALDALLAERDAARAQILELHEKVAFLESREVCAAAHDNVETCGYCQRDAARAELREAVRLIESNICYVPAARAVLDRVGKQPSGEG